MHIATSVFEQLLLVVLADYLLTLAGCAGADSGIAFQNMQ